MQSAVENTSYQEEKRHMSSTAFLRKWPLLLFPLFLASWLLHTRLYGAPPHALFWVGAGFVVGLLLLLLVFKLQKKSLQDMALPFLLVASFLMMLFFILCTNYRYSYHDLGTLGTFEDASIANGHMGYIGYLLKFRQLPTVNPLNPDYMFYYNPPFFHLLAALFFRGNRMLGLSFEVATENLQLLPMIFSCLSIYVIACILQALRLPSRSIQIGVLSAAFQPTFLIYSATLNNDILSMLLALSTTLFAIRWFYSQKTLDLLCTAAALGLGMATKLSVGILAFPLGILLVYCFFQKPSPWKKRLRQYLCFFSICVPLGMAWPLYQYFTFQVPLGYVPRSTGSPDLSAFTLWERFGIPSPQVLQSPYAENNPAISHNVWFQTLKTSVFDERILFPQGDPMWYVAYALLLLAFLFFACSLLFFIVVLIQKNSAFPLPLKLFWGGYAAAILVSYIGFCYGYPNICTFNFRYMMPSLMICSVSWASFCQNKKRIAPWLSAYLVLFSGTSLLVYILYLTRLVRM